MTDESRCDYHWHETNIKELEAEILALKEEVERLKAINNLEILPNIEDATPREKQFMEQFDSIRKELNEELQSIRSENELLKAGVLKYPHQVLIPESLWNGQTEKIEQLRATIKQLEIENKELKDLCSKNKD